MELPRSRAYQAKFALIGFDPCQLQRRFRLLGCFNGEHLMISKDDRGALFVADLKRKAREAREKATRMSNPEFRATLEHLANEYEALAEKAAKGEPLIDISE